MYTDGLAFQMNMVIYRVKKRIQFSSAAAVFIQVKVWKLWNNRLHFGVT